MIIKNILLMLLIQIGGDSGKGWGEGVLHVFK